jgi:hypothetical protein
LVHEIARLCNVSPRETSHMAPFDHRIGPDGKIVYRVRIDGKVMLPKLRPSLSSLKPSNGHSLPKV